MDISRNQRGAHGRAASLAQLRDRLEDSLIRRQLELVAHLLFVCAGALQRPGSIAHRDEAADEARNRGSVERIVSDELVDPA
jgi:hypothetical protein